MVTREIISDKFRQYNLLLTAGRNFGLFCVMTYHYLQSYCLAGVGLNLTIYFSTKNLKNYLDRYGVLIYDKRASVCR